MPPDSSQVAVATGALTTARRFVVSFFLVAALGSACTVTPCQTAASCDAGEVCTEGECVSAVPIGFEAQCMKDADCTYGADPVCLFASHEATSGLCTTACQSDADCGGTNLCVENVIQIADAGPVSGCVQPCSSTQPCYLGFACETFANAPSMACPPGCMKSSDCATGTCVVATGLCSTSTTDAGS